MDIDIDGVDDDNGWGNGGSSSASLGSAPIGTIYCGDSITKSSSITSFGGTNVMVVIIGVSKSVVGDGDGDINKMVGPIDAGGVASGGTIGASKVGAGVMGVTGLSSGETAAWRADTRFVRNLTTLR